MTDARRTFAPVVGAGVGAGILAAVAGARTWYADPRLAADPFDTVADAGEMPLASSLSLVLLACWGVLLFTRGRVRRVMAVLAACAAAGLLATVVSGYLTLPDRVAEAVREAPAAHGGAAVAEATGWFWAAGIAALVALAAAVLAVRWLPAWPAMGSRYDAPGGPAEERPPAERDSLDLWKSQDEGRDPTA